MDPAIFHLLADTATAGAHGASTTAELFTVQNGLALLTLTALEIVLGIDNVVFIAILAAKLPKEQQAKARKLGLALALITRVIFLTALASIIKLADVKAFEAPLIDHTVSWKDLIMLAGGLFLIGKATYEIHHKMEDDHTDTKVRKAVGFWGVIAQILVIDLVFSIDSVVTAVGMAQNIWVMVTAVVVSIAIMILAAGRISAFIDKHPTMKMLALSFLVLIGVLLVADGLGQHIPKGYIYFAMSFSLAVEVLNIRATRKRKALAGA